MPVSNDTSHRSSVEISKWTAYARTFFSSDHISHAVPGAKLELLDLFKHCRGVVKTFFRLDPGADPDITLHDKIRFAAHRRTRWFECEETILAFLARNLVLVENDGAISKLFQEVENALKAHGGTSRRRLLFIELYDPYTRIPLTDERSSDYPTCFP